MESDKEHYILITFIANSRAVVIQDQLSRFRFLTHAFQDPSLCSSTLPKAWNTEPMKRVRVFVLLVIIRAPSIQLFSNVKIDCVKAKFTPTVLLEDFMYEYIVHFKCRVSFQLHVAE